jgi:hypothetical protein
MGAGLGRWAHIGGVDPGSPDDSEGRSRQVLQGVRYGGSAFFILTAVAFVMQPVNMKIIGGKKCTARIIWSYRSSAC